MYERSPQIYQLCPIVQKKREYVVMWCSVMWTFSLLCFFFLNSLTLVKRLNTLLILYVGNVHVSVNYFYEKLMPISKLPICNFCYSRQTNRNREFHFEEQDGKVFNEIFVIDNNWVLILGKGEHGGGSVILKTSHTPLLRKVEIFSALERCDQWRKFEFTIKKV